MVPETIGAGSVTTGMAGRADDPAPLAQAAKRDISPATRTPLRSFAAMAPSSMAEKMAEDISALVNEVFGAMRRVRSRDQDRWPSGLRQRS